MWLTERWASLHANNIFLISRSLHLPIQKKLSSLLNRLWQVPHESWIQSLFDCSIVHLSAWFWKFSSGSSRQSSCNPSLKSDCTAEKIETVPSQKNTNTSKCIKICISFLKCGTSTTSIHSTGSNCTN